jgi:two-component system cell cycle sensor histidine kinase/response regulator CckA
MIAAATLLEGKDTAVQAARILLVEDERIVARSLQNQLTTLGYEIVASVPSGEAAVAEAGELRPDLVLMDIHLEGAMDGVEAAAAIRTQFRLPVVYLTAYSNTEILERAKVTEPFGYILKPYEERELHVVIQTALYKHRMERRQQEQEEHFLQAKKMEAIGQLAGGVAHAFNNLMTTVLGHSELMLQSMEPDDPYFASAYEIKKSATRTAALTQKLLAFSRKQLLTLRSLDLNALVGGLQRILRHLQAGVQFDLNLEPQLGTTKADPAQLEDAILTLARNACEAMPDGGRLTIQTANVELGQDYTHDHPEVRSGSYVLLAVSDTGAGMSPEAISHLFEPFFTNKAGVGAGLGLAAIYGFVKQCGGDIDVHSEMDEGTTFRVYLPRE